MLLQHNYGAGLMFLLLLISSIQGQALVLYVSPQGNDRWTGKLATPNRAKTDGPLATLQGARDAIRQLKTAGKLTEPVEVRIAAGTYMMTAPLVLGPQDSGTAQAPVVYRGTPGRSVFWGGRKITGFQPQPGGVWQTHIPEVARGEFYFEQLWMNGRRLLRARTPNAVFAGLTPQPRYLYVRKKMHYGTDPGSGELVDMSRRAFFAFPQDIQCLADIPPEQLQDVALVSYHAWETTMHRLQAVDFRTGAVFTTGNAPWAFQWLGPHHRYHLENFKAALDAPGEWLLERDGTLSIIPWPDTDMRTATIVAPVLPEFIRLQGAPEMGLYVEHLSICDLDFQYTGYILPPQGHGDIQAAVSLPAAIMADGARHVSLERLRVSHIGGTYGIWLRRGCRDCHIKQCEIFDLGAGGIKIGETFIQGRIELQTHQCTVDNNLIYGGGRLFHGAVGIWIGQSSDNLITHNDISDFYYTGISVGWSWGYNETLCKRNRLSFNHIHHLGWGVMSDMGGIYTLGRQDGAVISHNVIHDVYSWNKFGYAGLGIYNDEGSSGITIENNLVYDTRDSTYHQHYGRENVIRNNIFVNGENYQLSCARAEPHLSFTFENNIVYFRTGKLFWPISPSQPQWRFNRNVYWKEGGEAFDFYGLSFPEWQALGQDKDSVIADPKFRNLRRLDFALMPDSPALKLGFKPFDWRQAGLYGEAAWRERAPKDYPAVQMAPDPPPPPPWGIEEDFETYPAGVALMEGTTNVENKGDAIVVTDEAAASGTKSLKFLDAEGLQYRFNPHLVFNTHYREGRVYCSFDVWLEPGAELWHEFRDWEKNPYLVGPSLRFAEGKIFARERVLLDVPWSEWIHVEITAPLGEQARGQYMLRVTLPDKPAQELVLPYVDAQWKKLTYIGFISNAPTKSVFYVDNLKIQNLLP